MKTNYFLILTFIVLVSQSSITMGTMERDEEMLKARFPYAPLTDKFFQILREGLSLADLDFRKFGEVEIHGKPSSIYFTPGLVENEELLTNSLRLELTEHLRSNRGFKFQPKEELWTRTDGEWFPPPGPVEYSLQEHKQRSSWDFWGILWIGYDNFPSSKLAVYTEGDELILLVAQDSLVALSQAATLREEFESEYNDLKALIQWANQGLTFGTLKERRQVAEKFSSDLSEGLAEQVMEFWTETISRPRVRFNDSIWNYDFFVRRQSGFNDEEIEQEPIGFGAMMEWFYPPRIGEKSSSFTLWMVHDEDWKISTIRMPREGDLGAHEDSAIDPE